MTYEIPPKEKKSITKEKIQKIKDENIQKVLNSVKDLKIELIKSEDLILTFKVPDNKIDEFVSLMRKENSVEVIDEEYTKKF